ncbi:hypothetical protein BDR26DRAFT_850397 [Obelidium mucronatum]|nr:hypothetical protein BDR26DRAFT_850397 [Obelidium mucronatum]
MLSVLSKQPAALRSAMAQAPAAASMAAASYVAVQNACHGHGCPCHKPRTLFTAVTSKTPLTLLCSSSLLSNASVPQTGLAATLAADGVRSFKTKSALRLRCPGCFFTKRNGKLRVICKENPKHKQVQI